MKKDREREKVRAKKRPEIIFYEFSIDEGCVWKIDSTVYKFIALFAHELAIRVSRSDLLSTCTLNLINDGWVFGLVQPII